MHKKRISVILAVCLLFSLVCAFSGCVKKAEQSDAKTTAPAGQAGTKAGTKTGNNENLENDAKTSKDNSEFHAESNPVVTITMNDGGVITVELFPAQAPNTVNNFISLANKGFYDGVTFHRIISGFMIQGGDPKGNGTGGPGYSIAGEFNINGFDNPISHLRGTISMGRTSASYDSAGSQFFICHQDSPHLDGQYAAFGQVLDGQDVVDRIAETRTDAGDKPIKPVVIKSVTVDTKGVTYAEPVTVS